MRIHVDMIIELLCENKWRKNNIFSQKGNITEYPQGVGGGDYEIHRILKKY